MSASLEAAARWLTRAAALFLVAMMMITVVDVALRNLVNIAVLGTFDLVELFLVALVYLGIPETFLRREHVVAEVIDALASPRALAVLQALGSLLALALLVTLEIHMIRPALDVWEFREETLDLGIPRVIHWIPIHIGIACSIVAMLFIFVRDAAAVLRGAPAP